MVALLQKTGGLLLRKKLWLTQRILKSGGAI
jgi:hypothetical protein